MMTRTVIILRGLPGSGKSTLARIFDGFGAELISMDKFWTKDGQPYKFDRTSIEEAVAWTKTQFQAAIDKEEKLIVVDNTHSREWEYAFFKKTAEEMGYTTHVVEVQRGLFECFGAGLHKVPFEKIVEMAERFERPAMMTPEAQLKMLLIEISRLKAQKV